MPYAKRYNNKPKKMPIMGSKKDYSQDKAIKNIQIKIKKMENKKELKYKDTTHNVAPDTTGNAVSLCSGLVRGDEYNEREGDNIYAKSLRFSYILTKPSVAVDASSPPYQVRMIILWDLARNGQNAVQLFTGVAPTDEEEANAVFDDRDGMTTINAPYYHGTRDRYKILYDKIHVINSTNPQVNNSIVVRKSIPLSGAKITYTDVGDTGAVSELVNRSLIFINFTSGSATTALNFTSRLFYTDD